LISSNKFRYQIHYRRRRLAEAAMNSKIGTQNMIEQLVCATCGNQSSLKDKHVFKEALHALVRLAKAEKMLELKQDVKKAGALLGNHNPNEYWKIR
jgi:hypothetical protein